MVTPHLIIVGDSTKGARSYLSDHGFDFTTIKDKRLTKFPDKQLKHRVVADFSSRQKLLHVVDELHAKKPIHGVLVIYERFIGDASAIAEHLNLPGLPKEAAEACTDKFIMRQKFSAAPQKISPDFAVVTSQEGVRAFAEVHDFPLILKPANLSKSLLVSKAHNMDELLQNYAKTMRTIDAVYAKYAPGVTPKLLIEEFMEGPVHSVDAFVDSAGEPHVLDAVVDYQTGYDIGFDDNFHYSRLLPSKLPAQTVARIREVAALGCKALGMKNSPAHIEIILTSDGPQIVEIGARNGGYRDRMHSMANGIDLEANAIRLCLGEQPHIDATKSEPVGVFELFPKTPGIFTGIANEDRLRELPSLTYLSVPASLGSFVGSSSDGYKMCVIVILHNNNAEQFAKDMAFLNDHVAVQTAAASAT
ncbi:MAG TPA: ATP-grasp domain-containing protein [Candidatus Saccharimonadales bacterium]|nr:ATP-grasp domain-containing protein [Candidatus Saccharimonadales bacterium]